MNPTFTPFENNARVSTTQACQALGIVRNTLYSYAKTLGIFKVDAKVGRSFYWGKDINRIARRV